MAGNNPSDKEREEEAFRALFVAAFLQDDCEASDMSDAGLPREVPLSEEDIRALEGLGDDLVERIVAGQSGNESSEERERTAKRGHLVAMNRGDEMKELSANARAEMDRKIAEANERQSKESGK